MVGFTRDFFKRRNIPLYPWILSMIAAARWGGISIDAGKFRLDHDIDFFFQLPKKSSPRDAAVLLEELYRQIRHEFNIESLFPNIFCEWGDKSSTPLYETQDCAIPSPSGGFEM